MCVPIKGIRSKIAPGMGIFIVVNFLELILRLFSLVGNEYANSLEERYWRPPQWYITHFERGSRDAFPGRTRQGATRILT